MTPEELEAMADKRLKEDREKQGDDGSILFEHQLKLRRSREVYLDSGTASEVQPGIFGRAFPETHKHKRNSLND